MAMAEEQRNCKGTQYLLRLRTGNTITLLAKASHNTSLTREIDSLFSEGTAKPHNKGPDTGGDKLGPLMRSFYYS